VGQHVYWRWTSAGVGAAAMLVSWSVVWSGLRCRSGWKDAGVTWMVNDVGFAWSGDYTFVLLYSANELPGVKGESVGERDCLLCF